MPFSQVNSAAYQPLLANDFSSTLYEITFKQKSSPMMQLADIFLYPVCRAGYDKRGRDVQLLFDNRKLIDSQLGGEAVSRMGIKYSCFENVVCKLPTA
jgi:hypothetical protein